MPRRSAGVLVYRSGETGVEVLLAHPGGPLFARKDDGHWAVPKGEHGPEEDALAAAHREFAEELGQPAPAGQAVPLGEARQRSGKVNEVWAVEGDLAVGEVRSNLFSMQWPPRSGRYQEFPEIDRAQWFALAQARTKLFPAQLPFLDRLEALLGP